jgi:ATP-binding protein involved in chromosome partitioning
VASALAQRGLVVGLLDADVHGPSVPRMLQLEGERVRWGDHGKMIPAENFGLRVMSVGLTTPEADTPLAWRASVATSALLQLLDDVAWGPLDVLAVDLPPGTGDVQLTLAQELRVGAAVVVTTPQAVATDDVRRALRLLLEVGVPVAGVVENMSWLEPPGGGPRLHPFGEGGGRRLAEAYRVPFLAELPLDPAVGAAADAGTPIAAVGDEAQRARWAELAARLWEALEARPARRDVAAPAAT